MNTTHAAIFSNTYLENPFNSVEPTVLTRKRSIAFLAAYYDPYLGSAATSRAYSNYDGSRIKSSRMFLGEWAKQTNPRKQGLCSMII